MNNSGGNTSTRILNEIIDGNEILGELDIPTNFADFTSRQFLDHMKNLLEFNSIRFAIFFGMEKNADKIGEDTYDAILLEHLKNMK